ncbi:unnamed protein product [Rotaria sp. Silwood1]|nr:unnamed protein product [Rotaria sp. Silwood1]
MTKLYRIIITISILYLSNIAASNNNSNDGLPQSINELKQYYNFIKNLEQRGILNTNTTTTEKQLSIEHASKLAGRQQLLTEEELMTWKQRQLIISFSNVLAILAGITVVIALIVLISIITLPILRNIPSFVWEIFFFILSICLIILVHNSWLIFLGCLTFLATLSYTTKFHFSQFRHADLVASWIYFFVCSIVAIYQQHREAGYLAIMALETSLGFVIIAGELVIMIGFHDKKAIPSGIIASFVLILIGSFLHLQKYSNILTIPFTRPLLFLGTFVYFIGLIILSSRWYTKMDNNLLLFWLLQFIAFSSGLIAMLMGPLLELPFVQAIGGTMFVTWLLEKYAEIAPHDTKISGAASLLGFGFLLYGFAYFLKTHPEYFIFHIYASQ